MHVRYIVFDNANLMFHLSNYITRLDGGDFWLHVVRVSDYLIINFWLTSWRTFVIDPFAVSIYVLVSDECTLFCRPMRSPFLQASSMAYFVSERYTAAVAMVQIRVGIQLFTWRCATRCLITAIATTSLWRNTSFEVRAAWHVRLTSEIQALRLKA